MPSWRHGKIDVANPDYLRDDVEGANLSVAAMALYFTKAHSFNRSKSPSVLNVLNQFISRLTPWT